MEPEWIEKYAGRFDGGWDEYRTVVFERQRALGIVEDNAELSERDPDVAAWESLSDDERRMYARQMEVYAGFIEQTDHHFGRVIDFVDGLGELDNTIVIVMSDNGASAEGGEHGTFNEAQFFNGAPERLEDNLEYYDRWGGLDTYPHYSWGWTWAGNTPFRRWKRETYRGGITDPCIVSWPAGIAARGEVRHQYAHLVDIVPTLLDTIGIAPPERIGGVEQSPIHGTSFAHTFADADAASHHTTQYFEMFGSRSIYHDGWKANCPWPGPSFVEAGTKGRRFGSALTADELVDLDASGWELYRLSDDPTETHDLAADEPAKLAEMIERWYAEAETYGVFPLASAGAVRLLTPRPSISTNPSVQVWYPDAAPVYFGAGPKPYNRAVQHHRRGDDPARRRRGHHRVARQPPRWVRAVRRGRAARAPVQLPRRRPIRGGLQHRGSRRRRDVALRVRADGADPVPGGQGPGRQRDVVLRRPLGRCARDVAHDAEPGRPGRLQLRLRSLRHRRTRPLRDPVPVHRHDPPRHLRRHRRAPAPRRRPSSKP